MARKPTLPNDTPEGLGGLDLALIEAARDLIRLHHRPKWHTVSAALRGADGRIWTGLHLGTSVGRLAVCAEAVALGRAIIEGDGTIATAVALNDYITEIPITDFAQYGVILALKRDGNYMPVRDKGPLFIVYPYDSNPELKHQKYYGRSAWQVAQLIVK